MIGNSYDETNFSHKLLINTQVLKSCKGFANGSSANIKFSKTQLSKMVQLWGLTIYLSLIEGSLLDLFLQGLAKKEHIHSKKTQKSCCRWCNWWKSALINYRFWNNANNRRDKMYYESN